MRDHRFVLRLFVTFLTSSLLVAACSAVDDPTPKDKVCDTQSRCVDGVREVCAEGVFTAAPCGEKEFCDASTGACKDCVCEAGKTTTCIDDKDIETCLADCSGLDPVSCGAGKRCDSESSSCVEQLCTPGTRQCIDSTKFETCDEAGKAWQEPSDCPVGEFCKNGTCTDPCAVATQTKSNVGCEFWAADMANLPPRDGYVFAVAISNPHETMEVTVDVYDRNNGGNEQLLFSGTVAPRQVELFKLSGNSNGQQGHYTTDAGFLGTGISVGRAFRVKTNMPVVAVQFNPLGGASGHTTDASLLLPSHTIGKDHYHLAYDQGYGDGSSLVVVGTADATTVTLTTTVNTNAGQNGLPALMAGVPTAVVINRYDYIQLGSGSNDLSGTRIESSAPVAVFGGHTCANVPTTSTSACDHVEEQIFPLHTWGKSYLAARNPPRAQEDMVWRLVGSVDGTQLSFDPPSATLGASATIQEGEVIQFAEQHDFHVTADQPVLLAGYMVGCSAVQGGQGCPGDPYMTLMIPDEQFLSDYVFLVDQSYDQDFAKLIRPKGAQIELSCLGVVPEERWTAVGASGYEVAVIDMNPGEGNCAPGTNEATSNEPFGILVSGQASAASYGYPGGLALKEINIPK